MLYSFVELPDQTIISHSKILNRSDHRDCLDGRGNPKRRYFSRREAMNTAAYLRRARGVALRVYRCHDCGWWHLTKDKGSFVAGEY